MKTIMLFVFVSAICEAFWNIALKKSQGLTDWGINIIGVLFLIGGILAFKKAINDMSLSIAIVVWSGISLMLTILLDIYLFKTKVDLKILFFMGLCIVSILGLNYYSNK